MRKRKAILSMILGIILTIGIVPSTYAQETSSPSPQSISIPDAIFLPNIKDQEESTVLEGEYEGIRYKIIDDSFVDSYTPGTIQPMMKVGAGRYLYLYVNTAEFNGLSTAGGLAYTGVVCGMIAAGTGGVGGIACTAIVQGIFAYLRTRDAPKANQCGEIKLMWGVFSPVAYKVINKPCSKI